MPEIQRLLQTTSRTFALTIPFLPEPTRREVQVAYLLFRIIDTFEDARLWEPAKRAVALRRFVDLVEQPPDMSAKFAAECLRDPPVTVEPYLELLQEMPRVLSAFAALQAPARAIVRKHLARSAERMAGFVLRCDARGHLTLTTMDDLHDYCYSVAGIVGELLTELYILGRPNLDEVGDELRAGAAQFGEGLQLINILKDVHRDAAEGRTYLPSGVDLADVFAVADHDLAMATRYVETLRQAHADPGIVAFNASISKLALANLQLLRRRGLGAKLSRLEVARVQTEVMRNLEDAELPRFIEMSTD